MNYKISKQKIEWLKRLPELEPQKRAFAQDSLRTHLDHFQGHSANFALGFASAINWAFENVDLYLETTQATEISREHLEELFLGVLVAAAQHEKIQRLKTEQAPRACCACEKTLRSLGLKEAAIFTPTKPVIWANLSICREMVCHHHSDCIEETIKNMTKTYGSDWYMEIKVVPLYWDIDFNDEAP